MELDISTCDALLVIPCGCVVGIMELSAAMVEMRRRKQAGGSGRSNEGSNGASSSRSPAEADVEILATPPNVSICLAMLLDPLWYVNIWLHESPHCVGQYLTDRELLQQQQQHTSQSEYLAPTVAQQPPDSALQQQTSGFIKREQVVWEYIMCKGTCALAWHFCTPDTYDLTLARCYQCGIQCSSVALLWVLHATYCLLSH